MRRSAILVACCLFAACQTQHTPPAAATANHVHDSSAVQAATTAPVRHAGARVEFASPVPGASGYLSLPAREGKHPALIVIQEWWGLNDWIEEDADRFANQGYVALAVDLYRGRVAKDPEEAHELMRGLPEDRAVGDLQSAFNYLASRSDVDPARVGVIGWCMGGGYSLALAIAEPRLKASVINYGRLVTDPATIAKIQPAILGNFGATDKGIPPEDVQKFAKALKDDGKQVDIKIYDNAGHAFMNPNNTGGYDATAAADAWKRIDAFFAERLKSNGS